MTVKKPAAKKIAAVKKPIVKKTAVSAPVVAAKKTAGNKKPVIKKEPVKQAVENVRPVAVPEVIETPKKVEPVNHSLQTTEIPMVEKATTEMPTIETPTTEIPHQPIPNAMDVWSWWWNQVWGMFQAPRNIN